MVILFTDEISIQQEPKIWLRPNTKKKTKLANVDLPLIKSGFLKLKKILKLQVEKIIHDCFNLVTSYIKCYYAKKKWLVHLASLKQNICLSEFTMIFFLHED